MLIAKWFLGIAGKGDGNIRYYEYEGDNLYPLDEHKSSDPQRGMCFVPRRSVSPSECEIARAYKLTTNYIEPIAFIVPRKVSALPTSHHTTTNEQTDSALTKTSRTHSNRTSSHQRLQSSPLSQQANSSQARPSHSRWFLLKLASSLPPRPRQPHCLSLAQDRRALRRRQRLNQHRHRLYPQS